MNESNQHQQPSMTIQRERALLLEQAKNAAYFDRNLLALVLIRLALQHGFNAGRRTDPEGEPGWQTVLLVELPTGQVSWHVPDDFFGPLCSIAELPEFSGEWDGHTTAEKQARMIAFILEARPLGRIAP